MSTGKSPARQVFHIEPAVADDMGVVGSAPAGMSNQRPEFLLLGGLELGAGFLHQRLAISAAGAVGRSGVGFSVSIAKVMISALNGIRIIPGYNRRRSL